MPSGRGSCSSASVLAEAVRAGTAPAAILLGEPDLILTIGAAVAEELYGTIVPVVVLPEEEFAAIETAPSSGSVQTASPPASRRTLTTVDSGRRSRPRIPRSRRSCATRRSALDRTWS